MAFNDNQSDNALPVGANQSKRTSADHLPKYFRTDSNKKFLSATLDQLLNTTEDVLQKLELHLIIILQILMQIEKTINLNLLL